MMGPSWHPIRLVATASLWLGVGVALTVLIAGVCLLYSPLRPRSAVREATESPSRRAEFMVSHVSVHREGFGVRAGVINWIHTPTVKTGSLTIYSEDFVQAGWPMPAFQTPPSGFAVAETNAQWSAALGELRTRPTTGIAPRWMGAASREIPTSVMPSGLLVNALCFGAAAWTVAAGVGHTRHALRRRRGRCTRCAYPLAGLDRCPECGVQRLLLRRPGRESLRHTRPAPWRPTVNDGGVA